jgi:hypothetical protein
MTPRVIALGVINPTDRPSSQKDCTPMETKNTSPEKYVRIAITKNSRGYQSETTVSLRWDGDATAYTEILSDLNRQADRLARLEIRDREFADEPGNTDGALLDAAFTAAMKDGAR